MIRLSDDIVDKLAVILTEMEHILGPRDNIKAKKRTRPPFNYPTNFLN